MKFSTLYHSVKGMRSPKTAWIIRLMTSAILKNEADDVLSLGYGR